MLIVIRMCNVSVLVCVWFGMVWGLGWNGLGFGLECE